MRAIIVAAGMGSRLRPYTDDRPKTLVPVGGKPMLARQIEAYWSAGVTDFSIIRGYLKDRLVVPGAELIDNNDYASNNILVSLFHGVHRMDEPQGFVSSYGDIVFGKEAVRAVLDTPGDLVLCVDRQWKSIYEGRDQHPLVEAEVCRCEGDRVVRVGKKTVPVDQAHGEYIGLFRASAVGARQLVERYQARVATHLDQPYGTAPSLRRAYVTDLFNDLIADGVAINVAYIDGGWREIDTVQDLERAEALFG